MKEGFLNTCMQNWKPEFLNSEYFNADLLTLRHCAGFIPICVYLVINSVNID